MKLILIYCLLWCLTILLVSKTNNYYFLFLPYLFFIIEDVITCTLNTNIINSAERTSFFYDVSMLPTYFGSNQMNYSEAYYINDNYDISPELAEKQKFDMVISLLKIKPKNKVLTFGCGTCTFEKYMKEKGFDVYGFTLSTEQVNNCRKDNIKAFVWDMRKFNPKFENMFDHVIIMGSTEHMHGGCSKKLSSYKNKYNDIVSLFNITNKYLKKNGNVYFSGLHLNEKFINSREMYITDRMCGSTYALNSPGYTVKDAVIETDKFNVVKWDDATKRYFMTTATDDTHFGSPASPFCMMMIISLILSFIIPPFIYIYEFYVFGYWMWGFDGKHHFSFNKKYSLETMKNRPWTLWEGVFQKK